MEDKLVFVVQKHKATSLHYDFRLEIGGVMPSWSIPKGPSLDPSVRRLALPTEDHEMSYRTFEGVLPPGYGAGPVMVWDEGGYNAEVEITKGVRSLITNKEEGDKAMQKGMKEGNLKFRLYGKKLQGSFALVRTKGFGSSKGDSWLLIKHKDEFAKKGYDAADYDYSAVTNRSMAKIAEEG
jgi:bifunctional non-homologous end joining protein LigD